MSELEKPPLSTIDVDAIAEVPVGAVDRGASFEVADVLARSDARRHRRVASADPPSSPSSSTRAAVAHALPATRDRAWPLLDSTTGPVPQWAVCRETFRIVIDVDPETMRDLVHESSNRELLGDSAEGRELLEAVALLRARWDELDDDERASLQRTEAMLEKREWL